jgi:hypothetical protein
MDSKAAPPIIAVAERRQQREAQKRQRELERSAKEQAKLSAIEQARLEVATHENQLEVLLSIHKEQGEAWDWAARAASLPPICPSRNSYHELRARQRITILPPHQKEASGAAIYQARLEDDLVFQEAMQAFSTEFAAWEKMKTLARRVLAGEHKAYTEALVEFSPLTEISDLGSSIHFTVHSAKLIECALKVNGKQALPTEVKTLTASGKVSVKKMPRGRFHEIYQDYVCGCVLRVAREVFAFLPVETVLVTAAVDSPDPLAGQMVEQPVLSVVMPRAMMPRFDFEWPDPSDATTQFFHRGDFKASRKTEAFQPITPLTPADIPQKSVHERDFPELLVSVRRLREELKSLNAELRPLPSALAP